MHKRYVVLCLLFLFAAIGTCGASSQEIEPAGRLAALIGSMNDPDPAVRQAAVRMVGEAKDKAALPALSTVLEKDLDEDVRLAALGSLLVIGDAHAVTAYAKALKDESEKVRMSAAEALSGLWDEAALKGLVDALGSDPSPKVRRSAAAALGNPGIMGRYAAHKWEKAADISYALIRALRDDESQEVRATAASELGKFTDEKIIEPLLTAVERDKSQAVRAAAAESLGSFDNPKVIDKLIDLAYFETDEQVLIGALKALKSSNDKRLADPVTKLLKSGSPRVRWEAIDVIETKMTPSAADALKGIADDRYESEGVRDKARGALNLRGAK